MCWGIMNSLWISKDTEAVSRLTHTHTHTHRKGSWAQSSRCNELEPSRPSTAEAAVGLLTPCRHECLGGLTCGGGGVEEGRPTGGVEFLLPEPPAMISSVMSLPPWLGSRIRIWEDNGTKRTQTSLKRPSPGATVPQRVSSMLIIRDILHLHETNVFSRINKYIYLNYLASFHESKVFFYWDGWRFSVKSIGEKKHFNAKTEELLRNSLFSSHAWLVEVAVV